MTFEKIYSSLLNGELIEIVHQNRTIRLAPTERKSKISRLVRDALKLGRGQVR